MTNPKTSMESRKVRNGKCPVCKIKLLTYKRDGLYFCHRCDRRFDLETGRFQPNSFWVDFDKKRVKTNTKKIDVSTGFSTPSILKDFI